MGNFNRIKIARIENDFTQAQLAQAVGVTRQTIGLIERGRYNPRLKLCLATYAKGAVKENALFQYGKTIIPVVVIIILIFNYFQGNISTFVDLLVFLLSALLGTLLVGSIFYILYSIWKKRNELND